MTGFWSGDTSLFSKTMTYYGRWTYKFEEAVQGAKGRLITSNTAA
jgi:hypothetical protein